MEPSPACAQWYTDTITHLRNGELEKLVPTPCTLECHHCFYGIHNFSNIIPRPVAYLIRMNEYTHEQTIQGIQRIYGRPLTDKDLFRILVSTWVRLPFLRYALSLTNPDLIEPTSLLHAYYTDVEHLDYLLGPEVRMNIDLPNTNGSTILYTLLDFHYRVNIVENDVDDEEGEDQEEDEEDQEEDEEEDPYEEGDRVRYLEHLQTQVRPRVEYLLQRGADPLLPNKSGQSPLSFAESLTHCPPKEKEALLALLRRYA